MSKLGTPATRSHRCLAPRMLAGGAGTQILLSKAGVQQCLLVDSLVAHMVLSWLGFPPCRGLSLPPLSILKN